MGTLEDLSEPVDRDGVEAYIVLLQAMGGEVERGDRAVGRHGPDVERRRAARPAARPCASRSAIGGRGEEALPLIAEARKLHDALSADLRRPGLSLVLFAEVLTLGELGRMDAAAGRGGQGAREPRARDA